MANAPKTAPKKLRGGPTIQVDEQILRWRLKLKREEIKLGKAAVSAEKKNRYNSNRREASSNEKLIASFKKKFGG